MMSSYAERARRALRGAAVVALSTLALASCDDDPADPFEVVGEGTVTGILFFDVERDGAFEPIEGDSALAGIPVRMRVRGTNQNIPGTETTTDAEGRFTITNVPVGTHDIVFEVGGIGVVCNSPRPVSVRIAEVTSLQVSSQESCLIPITEAREAPEETPVTVRGVVTVGSGDLSASYYFIQDDDAGVKVLTPANAVIGQFVEVSGETDLQFSEILIVNASLTVLGEAPLPDPIVLTGEQFVSHEFQGLLATLEGLTVTEIEGGVPGPGVSYNAHVEAPDGADFIVRVDSDADIAPTTFAVGNVYTITGVVSPFGGAEQLYVRSQADIVPVP